MEHYYVYKPDANNYAGIGVSCDDDDFIIRLHNDNLPLLPQWIPLFAHRFDNDAALKDGDFPSLTNFWRVPVMSQRAWDRLYPLIGYCCEPLPIVHPSGKPFFVIHVMETIDCLDTDRSEVKRFSDGGIMRVIRYAFNDEMLIGKHIFKLPRECGGELIVDDEFRQAVERNSLNGLDLQELRLIG
jgi:hypothetical protein